MSVRVDDIPDDLDPELRGEIIAAREEREKLEKMRADLQHTKRTELQPMWKRIRSAALNTDDSFGADIMASMTRRAG